MARKSRQTSTRREDAALAYAETVCRERGLSFTALRSEVFRLLCRHQRPVGAYELLEDLQQQRPRAAPITIYRALDFLVDAGLAHKISKLNAFTACRGSDRDHSGLILICRECSSVIELEDRKVETSIQRSAADQQFAVGDELVEVVGTCAACRQ